MFKSVKEKRALIKLGQLIVRMINDILKMPKDGAAYSVQRIVLPGDSGEVYALLIRDEELLDKFNKFIDENYKTTTLEKNY